jgi:hypothetical protein
LVKATYAFKVELMCFFCAKDKDNGTRISKESLEISYCVLYLTRYFMSKVKIISKFSGNLMT